MRNVTILLTVVVMLAATAQAATISYTEVTNDADSGISSAKTYTHTLNFGKETTDVSINEVDFVYADIGNLPANLGLTNVGTGYWANQNDSDYGMTEVDAGTGLYDLMHGMGAVQGNTATAVQTVTLKGLTVDELYSTRIYSKTRGQFTSWLVEFDAGKDGVFEDSIPSIDQGNAQTSPLSMSDWKSSYYIEYEFTALSDELNVKFTSDPVYSGGHWRYHNWAFYGVTNEVVPEPATLVLLGIGGIGVLLRRRRK